MGYDLYRLCNVYEMKGMRPVSCVHEQGGTQARHKVKVEFVLIYGQLWCQLRALYTERSL